MVTPTEELGADWLSLPTVESGKESKTEEKRKYFLKWKFRKL